MLLYFSNNSVSEHDHERERRIQPWHSLKPILQATLIPHTPDREKWMAAAAPSYHTLS